MSRPIVKGSVDNSTIIRIVDSGDGTPETGVTSATGGLDLKYRRALSATVNLTESDLSALTDAHSDGGMLHIGAGYYRVDVPDAAFASGADHVLIFGTVTGMVVIGAMHELVDAKIPVLVGGRVDASVGAMAANVLTATAINADAITTAKIADGALTAAKFAAGAFDAVWTVAARTLTSFGTLASDVWAVATRVLTAGTNIVLAKGTGVTGFNDLDAAGVRGAVGLAAANLDTQLTGINDKTTNLPTDPADQSLIIAATDAVVAAIAALNNLSAAQVATELGTYDAPTKAELDSAVAALATAATLALVKAKTDSLTFTVAGQVDANAQYINDVELTGTGVLGDEWDAS